MAQFAVVITIWPTSVSASCCQQDAAPGVRYAQGRRPVQALAEAGAGQATAHVNTNCTMKEIVQELTNGNDRHIKE